MTWRTSIAVPVSVAGCGLPEVIATDAATDARPLEGAWEPDPGLGRTGALLVADGPDVWFVYGRAPATGGSEVWMTKTTATGSVLVPPVRVDAGPEATAWPASIARSQASLAVTYLHSDGTSPPRLRMFDAAGTPARATAQLVPMGSVAGASVTGTALAARPDGTMRLFATQERDTATEEVVMVELDRDGDAVGKPTLIGTADVGVPSHLAAAFAPDGTTYLAWDRVYDECRGRLDPDATVTTRVGSDGTPSTLTDVQPLVPSDREPSIAALDGTAYLAWTSETTEGTDLRVARADQPASVVAVVGNPAFGNHAPMLALAAPGRGALAWMTYEPAIRVAEFHEENGAVVVSPPYVFAPPADFTLHGIVAVAEDRFVVAWTEAATGTSRTRLFAVAIDLSLPAKASPSDVPASGMPARQRGRRCSH